MSIWTLCLFLIGLFAILLLTYLCFRYKSIMRYIICKKLLPFCGLLSTFLMVSFAAQKFAFYLTIFFFCCLYFWYIMFCLIQSKRFMAMFSSRSFLVLAFILRFLIV